MSVYYYMNYNVYNIFWDISLKREKKKERRKTEIEYNFKSRERSVVKSTD